VHIVSVPLVKTSNSQISLLLLTYFETFRYGVEIFLNILMNEVLLEFTHQPNESFKVLDVSLSEYSFFLVDKRFLDKLADLALILEDPLLKILVLVFRVRCEISHDKFLLQLFVKPSVDHSLTAANVNLSEIFEVTNQLIL